MKIIFAGTTEFAIPTLEKLRKDHELVLVITQPDKPSGRNKVLTPPPMKIWAEKNHVRVAQPVKIAEALQVIKDLEPDLMIVAAYGQIIPKEVLDASKHGAVNIHGSILPKYRGASPIQSAILNGETETGVTLIKMDEKMDHGPILTIRELPIGPTDTFKILYAKMATLSADVVAETLPKWVSGQLKPIEQDHSQATFCGQLTRENGKINWSKPVLEIDAQIRALNPEPGTWTTLGGKIVKILEAEVLSDHKIELPGKIYVGHNGLAVKCLDNALFIKKIQPEGKNPMSGLDYLNGLKNLSDKIFI